MVTRCRASGVNIYVDAVINHMTGIDRVGSGTGGSNFDGPNQEYPDFSASNFHQPYCPVQVKYPISPMAPVMINWKLDFTK